MEATTFALPATPRQIAYARSLALRNQTLLPWEIQQDRRSLSSWIDAQAQMKPIAQIAQRLGIDPAVIEPSHFGEFPIVWPYKRGPEHRHVIDNLESAGKGQRLLRDLGHSFRACQ